MNKKDQIQLEEQCKCCKRMVLEINSDFYCPECQSKIDGFYMAKIESPTGKIFKLNTDTLHNNSKIMEVQPLKNNSGLYAYKGKNK